jgi:hypothetical protein
MRLQLTKDLMWGIGFLIAAVVSLALTSARYGAALLAVAVVAIVRAVRRQTWH